MLAKQLINTLIEDDYELYRLICKDQKKFHPNEDNDCFVKAIAIVCGVPYSLAHQVVEAVYYRKSNKGTRGAYDLDKLNRCLNKFGKKAVNYDNEKIRTSASAYNLKDGYFICGNSDHAFAVVNGVVEDWSKNKRLRLKYVFKVIDKTDKPPKSRSHIDVVSLEMPSSWKKGDIGSLQFHGTDSFYTVTDDGYGDEVLEWHNLGILSIQGKRVDVQWHEDQFVPGLKKGVSVDVKLLKIISKTPDYDEIRLGIIS